MPQPVQHLVFGTGLTGGFLLGALMHSKVSVVAVGRESVQDQWQQGLTLTDYDEHAAKVPAPQFVDTAFGPVDILWLTVKCTATANIIESLKPFVGPHTVIVCCQNGFGSDQPLKDAFPDNALHHAIVGFNVAQIENGHLRRATEGDFVIDALLFGGVDMAAELRCENAWGPLLYARSRVVHAAANAGVDVIEVPWLDLDDPDGMVEAADQARALGFSGKGAVHPKQIAQLNAVFTPTDESIARARRIIDTFEAADTGLVVIDGKLIEKPVLREMYRIVAIAERSA